MSRAPQFSGGENVALKVADTEFELAVRFFRDVLKMDVERLSEGSANVKFGKICLWIDSTAGSEQGEIWLEIRTDDTRCAAEYLSERGIARCDRAEPLPSGYDGFWIRSPFGQIILVSGPNQ